MENYESLAFFDNRQQTSSTAPNPSFTRKPAYQNAEFCISPPVFLKNLKKILKNFKKWCCV